MKLQDASIGEPAGLPETVSAFLHDLWYVAMPSSHLKRGRDVAKRILDVPLLFGRDNHGAPFVLHNICRHQGMPLSCGRFDGAQIECSNHGWRYDTTGQLVSIPALAATNAFDLARIRLQSYPCRDVQGNLWVYMGDAKTDLPPVPTIPGIGDLQPAIEETMLFPCTADRAALGLIDPAHGPYVHRSWFWRNPRNRKEKERRFTPSYMGFTMEHHTPTKNTLAFRLLPGTPDIEIRFQLPGVHIELLTVGRHTIGGMIAITPITPAETEVSYFMYWTVPWLRLIRPIVKLFTHAFFKQDKKAMDRMADVPTANPPFTLVGDPDAQAVWYFQLKREFIQARADGRAFQNPLRESVRRWNT